MLAALRAYEQVSDPRAIRAWLFSIAAHNAIDAHRATARAPVLSDQIDEQAVAREASSIDEDELWERVRGLPEKQRQAITLRYRGDLTHREVAQVMQISEAAARRNAFEGLKRLRRDPEHD